MDDATHAIILSQDCDVVHEDLKVEPYAEILFLLPVEKPNPGLKDGKSSRRFHLKATQNGHRFTPSSISFALGGGCSQEVIIHRSPRW